MSLKLRTSIVRRIVCGLTFVLFVSLSTTLMAQERGLKPRRPGGVLKQTRKTPKPVTRERASERAGEKQVTQHEDQPQAQQRYRKGFNVGGTGFVVLGPQFVPAVPFFQTPGNKEKKEPKSQVINIRDEVVDSIAQTGVPTVRQTNVNSGESIPQPGRVTNPYFMPPVAEPKFAKPSEEQAGKQSQDQVGSNQTAKQDLDVMIELFEVTDDSLTQ